MNTQPTSAHPATSAIRAYLGGSFNPVHNGHIQMAMHVYNTLLPIAKEEQRSLYVSLLPNARSPFKQKTIAPEHRLAMLKLATKDTPLQISELELWQSPPVYSIDSVRKLKQHYPNDSLIFIMGMDSLSSLDKWKDGLKLTDYVHLWVFERFANTNPVQADQSVVTNTPETQVPVSQVPDSQVASIQMPIELKKQITDIPANLTQPINTLFLPVKQAPNQPLSIQQTNPQPLNNERQGRIYLDPYPIATISSTLIRKQLSQPLFNTKLTSTELISNPSTAFIKLLNPAVYRYIIAHQLYSAA
ncbi:nicotinate-nicotinamide nucleotide adenylyltransferase [uncultured Psychrobacter sp.]|uniref:nicotinate-nicotinamide nucleotide adenylyltransferase n=1 Tax=uncultured Psychrobacter sp. TaxID=259303 RepID=UPI003458ED6F